MPLIKKMTITERIKRLQRAICVEDDGKVGNQTLTALESRLLPKDTPIVADEFSERTERNIATLLPKAQEIARRFMHESSRVMAKDGIRVEIISGNRTYAEQDELYAKGRTKPGNVVTNARGGYSNHNFGIAFDIGLFRGNEYLKSSPLYDACGAIGKSVGLEWGGDWKSFVDKPHFEVPTGLTTAQKRARVAKGEPIL